MATKLSALVKTILYNTPLRYAPHLVALTLLKAKQK